MSEWGRVFLDILTTHGVSQQKLSHRIGYDHSTLSRYVNGSRVPTREVCAAISDALTPPQTEGRTIRLEGRT